MLIIITMLLNNELIYLNEWITFHKKQGVSLFYIYLININIDFNLEFENVNFIKINFSKYCHIYHFFKYYYQKHLNDWISIIDIDEFLYSPLKNKNIIDIIDIYEKEKKYAIAINWKCFGSNNIKNNSENKVLNKFIKCAKKYNGINCVIKSLVKINVLNIDKINQWNIHKFILKDEYKYFTTNGIDFIENNKNNINNLKKERINYLKKLGLKLTFDINDIYTYPEIKPLLLINHYITRSKNEYLLKIKNNHERKDRYNLNTFKILNNFINEVEDKTILNKL
jgi:hypothetical protein